MSRTPALLACPPFRGDPEGSAPLTGYPDGPPIRGGAGGFGVAFTDVAGAYYGTYSILAALEYRKRTGKGLWLDLSHYEAGVATLPEPVLDYEMNGRVRERVGNRHPDRAPQGAYACAGEDEWIAISVASADQFEALAEVLGLDTGAGRFATRARRQQEHDLLDEMITASTRKWDAAKLEVALQAAGVEATRLQSPKDVWFDPQLQARGFGEVAAAPDYAPEIGVRVFPRPAWRMTPGFPATSSPAPAFGEHTREVLTELLHLGGDEIAELERRGTIAAAPREGLISARQLDLAGLLEAKRLREIDPGFRARLEARFGADGATATSLTV